MGTTSREKNYFIKNKFAIFVIAICSIGAFVATLLWHQYRKSALITHSFSELTYVMQQQVSKINNYLELQKQHLVSLAQNPIMRVAFDPELTTTRQAITELIQNNQEFLASKRILLIDLQGTIIYSSKSNQDLNLNIKKFQPPTALSQSYTRTIMTLVPDIAEFAIDPFFKEQALFICTPVIYNNTIVGVIAHQVDEEKIYKLTRSYRRLGTTGETVIAKAVSQGAQIIAPTRHAPDTAFKHYYTLHITDMGPLHKSILGKTGIGMGTDYRKHAILAAWSYIPQAAWGIVVKQDIQEVLQPLVYIFFLVYFFSIISCCAIGISLYNYWDTISRMIEIFPIIRTIFHYNTAQLIRLMLWCIIIASIIVSAGIYWYIQRQLSASLYALKATTEEKLYDTQHHINHFIDHFELVANAIADDLSAGRLDPSDLTVRMRRDLSEHPKIEQIIIAYAPHEYQSTVTLYAPTVIREEKDFLEKNIEQEYDYTVETSNVHRNWYTKTIHTGKAQWFDPEFNDKNQKTTVIYAVPFYKAGEKDNIPRGIVAARYNLEPIITAAQYITIGRIGYAFIVKNDGSFIYHPINSYIRDNKTFFSLAEEQGNEALRKLIQDMAHGKSGLSSYTDNNTQQQMWLAYRPIKSTQWSLAITFSEQEAKYISQSTRRAIMWLIITLLITLLSTIALLFHIEAPRRKQLTFAAFSSIGAISCCLFLLWYFIAQTAASYSIYGTIITQQTGLSKFIEEKQQEARHKNEPIPIAISTGFFLYSLFFPTTSHMAFTARIWQLYDNQKHKNITPGVQISKAQNVEIEKIFDEQKENERFIGWKIDARIPQQYNYTRFPFDANRIAIPIEQADITEHIMLVPDLSAYTSLNPEEKPGIDINNLDLPGFTIKESFFSFEPEHLTTTFGIKDYEKVTSRVKLIYNIIITRNLLNPIIIYFLPLLIVLFSLFAVFWITARKQVEERHRIIFSALGAYTGLFFALLILHRNLREQYPVGDLLYIEYFFFYTYVTILLFTIHAIVPPKNPHVSYILTILFWPIQLILWIITTIIIFY